MAEDISLSKLLQVKDAKGKVLRACYIVGEARFENKSACMWLQSEDGRHRVIMQVDGFVCSDKEALFWFPEGCKLDIVDPRLLGGVLRVPDASSVVYTGAKQQSKDPDAIRKAGNMAFSKGNFVKAAMLYTESIKASSGSPEEGLVSAYSNRSQAFFNLGWFESALEDADRALELCPDHLKSLMRKSKALCGLSRYVEALECVAHVQGGIEFTQAASRYRKLVEQSNSGILDLSEFLMSRGGSVPEYADYVDGVRISMASDGCGRGVFATKKFEAGELVLAVNALATGRNNDELDAALVRASFSSAKTRQQLECLIKRNIVPTMDVFKANRIVAEEVPVKLDNAKIRDLVGTHSFGWHYPQFDDKAEHTESVWLWSLPALINHACAANVCLEIVGRAVFVRAGRPIKAGDEITISYVDPLLQTPFTRNARIRECWNFSCNCPRCRFELEFESKSRSSKSNKKSNKDVTKSEALDIIHRSKQESSNLSQEQGAWILASYTPQDITAYDVEILRAAYATAPGYMSTTNALVCVGIKDGFLRTQPETRQLWRDQVLSQFGKQAIKEECYFHTVAMLVERWQLLQEKMKLLMSGKQAK